MVVGGGEQAGAEHVGSPVLRRGGPTSIGPPSHGPGNVLELGEGADRWDLSISEWQGISLEGAAGSFPIAW